MNASEEIELLARKNELFLCVHSPLSGMCINVPNQHNIGLAKTKKMMNPQQCKVSLRTINVAHPHADVERRFDVLWLQLLSS